MENKNHHEIIPVLGIMLDSISVPRAVEISQGYMSNDYFNFVLLADAKMALDGRESEELQTFIKSADLILPGDHTIETAVDRAMGGKYQAEYLDQLLMALADRKGHLCILCNDADECEKAKSSLLKDYPGVKVDGVVFEQADEEAMEALVNTINGYFPDLILPLVSMEKQRTLLLTHRETLSAKLYVSSEALSSHLLQEEKDSPSIVKWLMRRLHIGEAAVESKFWDEFGKNSQN